ncbi:bifunctional diaminohydroxyphosphoribosylaminopyrimidine deaminase/5-amino-6-(5-phosphoribosylamino)uracil reductase RibD [Candidatus Micrarchaeota archaeon]|nr:bifunctional diaminohydroxyphosphoribosylaminopyrimidine deaminase/5-amino-6-(5-phosphoribosylamino)uracil reductase RibD [Candidatus Micrarchaeota archaeon]
MDRFMKQAFRLARKANPYPNPRVGAVLVKGGEIIGAGFHKAPGKPHAEIEAIRDAKHRTKNPHAARGATLYVTLEPCSHTAKRTPPCTKAIIREGIAEVAFAMKDPNPLVCGAGAKELAGAGVRVRGPTDTEAAGALNRRYMAAITKRPLVAIKMAMSADGKTATRTGDSRWISCPESRALVHRMRAEYDAVMVGAGTIETDDPELTTHGKGRDPCRIIIDGRLRIGTGAGAVRNRDGKTIVVISENADRAKALAIQRCGARVLVCGRDDVDLKKLMVALSALGIRKILIEGGSGLNAKALEAGIVDRLFLFIAPKIIGGRGAKPVVGGIGIESMKDAIMLDGMTVRRVGRDVLLEARLSR